MSVYVSPTVARDLAYSWHGGQSSPLYAFTSSGLVMDRAALLREVESCEHLAQRTQGYTESDLRDLRKLRHFVLHDLSEAPATLYPYRAPWARQYETIKGE